MIRFFTASFDASVYLQQPDQNAGRDEVLEIGKLYYGDSKEVCRTLIKFNTTSISASIVNGEVSGSWKAYLNFKSVEAEELPLEYTIYANAVSQSWSMGTGTKFDNITSDGVSWKYKNGIDKWQNNTVGGTATYTIGTTGSANAEGGTWYTASEASQSFNYEEADVRMDVTEIVKLWNSGSANGGFDNNGFVIHHSLENESDTTDYGLLKFFSKETNTIYEPKLELVWNDQIVSTGSLSPVTGSASDDDYKVVITNLKSKYPTNSIAKVRLKGRDIYPLKSFGNTFEYAQTKYLPTGSTYYQLEDYKTGDIIFPFGEYTKISCDNESNYFKMDLSTLPMSRTYRLKIKIVEDGISTVIDDRFTFEIE
jgi:hypothetical protein